MIQSSRYKRKCVDMENISSRLPDKATDYIIEPKSDQTKPHMRPK